MDDLESIYLGREYEYLTDLNTTMLHYFLKKLNIKTKIITASDYNFSGKKSDLVLDMCTKLEAKKIIFGENGKDYVDIDSFRENKIETIFQEYVHPSYNQLFQKNGFVPYMSIIDLLFNEGSESKDILMSGNIQKV